ncbi:hypothetical protein G9U51_06655 [Calidifontibacter sp. DB0510]|uniref:HTH luxR-type domain-containing protein n=1 Tax=Metallococcus carri TaxID=1656884 RepID=A0A967AZC2_9MICO|nr:LuxR C-terminal-related transcriptional regulator [Metallococcus carri]NHN55463.1 hypothetical protein [Metallococcus carri]NOP38353.1 hypothetical protein [Calidifontibacter sp. DB2511S]
MTDYPDYDRQAADLVPDAPETGDEFSGIYLAMLEQPVVSIADLQRRGFSTTHILDAFDRFASRGMVQRISDDSVRVLPPDVSLPAFAGRLEEFARVLRSSAPGLNRFYLKGLMNDSPAPRGVSRLAGVVDVGQATQQLLATAQHWVRGSRTDTPYTKLLLELPLEFHERKVTNKNNSPLSTRAVLDPILIEHGRFGEVLHARARAGEDQRLTSGLPFSVLVNDQGLAVVDMHAQDDEAIGFFITAGAATGRALTRLVDWTWRLGTPLRHQTREVSGFDARDQQILSLLAGGATDSTIARQLGVSQRTIERRIRRIMDHLNATTRFQAGVLGAKRGLL